MDSKGLGFWRTVWGQVVAGLLVAGIIAATSGLIRFHHQAQPAVVAAAGWLWRLLTFSVPVPFVLTVAFTLVILYVWLRAVLRNRESVAEPNIAARVRTTIKPEPSPLTENEMKVIRVLAKADGRSMSPAALARSMELSNLVTDQAIERLVNRKFLEATINDEYMRVYCLSPTGRDYVIAEGYVENRVSKVRHYSF